MTVQSEFGTGDGWWSAATPLTLEIRCGVQADDADHQMTWVQGTLALVDHPDIDAELAMVALGGVEPPCVARYRLWHEAVSDGGFIGEWVDDTRLSPAWFSWLAMALERMRSEGFHEFLRRLPPARAQRMGEFLHLFPTPWIDRAAATVSHRIVAGDGVGCAHAAGLLMDAAAHRLRRAFVDAVGGRQLAVGSAALVPLDLSIGPRLAVAGALTGAGRGVNICVSRDWLHQVWAAGAAVIDGELTLELTVNPRSDSEQRGTHQLGADAVTVRWGPSATPRLEHRQVRFDGVRWARGTG